MPHRERDRHELPPAREPHPVPDRLLRDVGVPDQEELREADVGPEHREREQQLAEVVQVLGAERRHAGPARRSATRHDRQEGEARHQPPANKYTPKIVEYQCGASDISQSKAAKVVVSASGIRSAPL